jgi:HlyD family secretion protein
MIVQKWIKTASLIGIVLLAGGGVIAYCSAGIIKDWLTSPAQVRTILVSGNIEAHQSVLGFKTVQSRIVELPFDEGQWVKAGTVIARLDDSDYSQQVKIAEAAIEVQRRQLATTEQNLVAARKTVEADAADLEMKTADFGRADTLLQKGAGTVQARDQANAALRQSNAASERDQALQSAAERQVELAKANIRNANETLKMAQIAVCTENVIRVDSRRNRLTSVDHVRTILLRPGRFGRIIRVDEPT